VLWVSFNSSSTLLADVRGIGSAGHLYSAVDLWPLGWHGSVRHVASRYPFTTAVFAPHQPGTLALGDQNGHVDAYDVATGRTRLLYTDSARGINVLAYNAAGSLLALGDGDGDVVVLDAESGRAVLL
jgi:hypothetical protein